MKKLLLIITILFTFNINAQEIKFGKVSKEELEEKIHPLDSTADAAYLLKKRRTYFRYDSDNGFIVETEYHERIKIYTQDGFGYATKKITFYKPKSGAKEEIINLKAYTFNLQNNKINKQKLSKKDIFEEQLSKYRTQSKITLPNIKKGSIIDLKYTLKSPYWNNIKPLNYQYKIPIKKLSYKIEIPEYFIFNKRQKGFYSISPQKTKKNNSIVSVANARSYQAAGHGQALDNNHTSSINYISNIDIFTQENIPALNTNEPFSGNINNYRGGMEYELSGTHFPNSMYKSYATNWESVCKTIYKSPEFGNQLEKKNYYKDDLQNILNITKDDFEKITLILQFVKSKVKWNNYYGKYTDIGVKKAYKEGNGNVAEINLMLTSILRYAGLQSNPVLISTKNNGIPLFPTRKGFNYVISKVNLKNGKTILLDATKKYSYLNVLPYKTLNWYGREVLKNGESIQVSLTPPNYSKENNILHVKINDLGEINGILRRSLTGHTAMFYRQKNNVKKEEEVITSLEEKHNIEIDNFKTSNKENISKPITQTLKFISEDHIEEINGKLYFTPLFFLGTKENPFKSEERNFPVDYGLPWQNQFSVSITIPDNYTVESYPKNLAIGLPEGLGVFKYQINIQGNKIKLSSILQINSSIIAPQYYSTLKEFYKDLVEKQTEKIILIKK